MGAPKKAKNTTKRQGWTTGEKNYKSRANWATKRLVRNLEREGWTINGINRFDDGDVYSFNFKIAELKGWEVDVHYFPAGDDMCGCFEIYHSSRDTFDDIDLRTEILQEVALAAPASFRTFFEANQLTLPKSIRYLVSYVKKEPYLCFCRNVFGFDYNLHYITRRAAKKMYRRWLKEAKKAKPVSK